jgi:hypothetical protein
MRVSTGSGSDRVMARDLSSRVAVETDPVATAPGTDPRKSSDSVGKELTKRELMLVFARAKHRSRVGFRSLLGSLQQVSPG